MRSIEEAKKMINILKDELRDLPDISLLGTSNIEDKNALEKDIEELEEYIETEGNVLPKDIYSQVRLWLFNGFSVLNDYEV